MSAHTPGPWKQHLVDETLIVANDQAAIASTSVEYFWAETAEANARLIAAAPELLELALQYISDLRHPMSDDSRQRRIERAEAVITKAGGRA